MMDRRRTDELIRAAESAAIDRAARRAERDAAWESYEWANQRANDQYDAMPIARGHAQATQTPEAARVEKPSASGHTS